MMHPTFRNPWYSESPATPASNAGRNYGKSYSAESLRSALCGVLRAIPTGDLEARGWQEFARGNYSAAAAFVRELERRRAWVNSGAWLAGGGVA